MVEVETRTHTRAHTHTHTNTHTYTHTHTHTHAHSCMIYIPISKVLSKDYVCVMFHIPLGDGCHGVSLFVLIPSSARGGVLILLVAIVTMVVSGDYLIIK